MVFLALEDFNSILTGIKPRLTVYYIKLAHQVKCLT